MVKHLVILALVAVPTMARAEMQRVYIDDRDYAQPPPPPVPAPQPTVIVRAPEPPARPVPQIVRCEAPEPSHDKLGFRITFGRLHLTERDVKTVGLALHVEHPVFRNVRLFAEYEYLWLDEEEPTTPVTAGYTGTGHRALGGVRAEMIGATIRDAVHFYVDAELGGGIGVISDEISGAQLVPQVFAGVRAGYDYLWGHKTAHSSRVWEAEVIARAFRFDGGTGAMFGIGMGWGD